MANKSIKVENLSKIYRLGEIGTGTVSRDVERFVKTKILKQEDPFLKIGEVNNRAINGASDIVYSLKGINFEIEQGDAVGIIGRNGAGKSTLLKLLSRITSPTTGKINIRGRVASLLEVGTGFHPELTGRENIYLNGAILGMRKREIDQKLDEIIDFSGVERYIDTPVKRYSSGMYVRLAFAVAAHLESEILIIDEVLAVGDAEFQKKCLGKMGEMSKGEGRTVLFVSHNIPAIQSLCKIGILLENGFLKHINIINKTLEIYSSEIKKNDKSVSWDFNSAPGNQFAKILSVNSRSENNYFIIEKEFYIDVIFVNLIDSHIVNVSISIFDNQGTYILASPNLERVSLTKGTFKSTCRIPENLLNKGVYYFSVFLVGNQFEIIAQLDKVISIEMDEEGLYRRNYFDHWSGVVRPYLDWSNRKI